MLTFDGICHFGEVFSSRMNPGFHCTGQMVDGVYGVVSTGVSVASWWVKLLRNITMQCSENNRPFLKRFTVSELSE